MAAGVRVVQHRDKEADTAAMIEEARLLRRLCREALFLINDRVEVALAVDADGVHLGQEDLHYSEARRLLGERKIIGITVNTVEQALGAASLGPTIWECRRSLPPKPKPTPANRPGYLCSERSGPWLACSHRHRRHHPGQRPGRH